jgi:hypothetical protein
LQKLCIGNFLRIVSAPNAKAANRLGISSDARETESAFDGDCWNINGRMLFVQGTQEEQVLFAARRYGGERRSLFTPIQFVVRCRARMPAELLGRRLYV